MQRRTLVTGLSALAVLSACGGGDSVPLGDSTPFRIYSGPPITQIQVYKSKRIMYLFAGDTVEATYKISLGGTPVGPKQFEGDGKTPEGLYHIELHNPNSAYHRSIKISYPNQADRDYAKSQGKKPGGDIFIHGENNIPGKSDGDWTAGCIAVKNDEIEQIYAMVPNGTPVFIFP